MKRDRGRGILAGHAEAGRVHEQAAAGKHAIPLPPIDHGHRRAKRAGQGLGPAACAVGKQDPPGPFCQKSMQDRPRCAARAEHHHRTAALVPVGRLCVEIGHEAVGVGVARVEPPCPVEPQRVGRSDRSCRLVGHRRKPQRRLLVRKGDIGAPIAMLLERAEKPRQILGPHRFLLVSAVDAVLLQPVAMDQRRAGMLDRPADDTGAQHEPYPSMTPSRRSVSRSGRRGRPRIEK